MKHTRPPTPQDLSVLANIRQKSENVAIAPIFVDGKPRLGLVLVVKKKDQHFMQLLAILPEPEEVILNGQGKAAMLSMTLPSELH